MPAREDARPPDCIAAVEGRVPPRPVRGAAGVAVAGGSACNFNYRSLSEIRAKD